MKIELVKRITRIFQDNDPRNEVMLESLSTGGSGAEFFYKLGYDQADELSNNFEVREVQPFVWDLYPNNTFSEDVLAWVRTPGAISFVDIICVEAGDQEKRIPVRFNLALQKGADVIEIGYVSGFNICNGIPVDIDGILISDVRVPEGKVANLIVHVGCSTRDGDVPDPDA